MGVQVELSRCSFSPSELQSLNISEKEYLPRDKYCFIYFFLFLFSFFLFRASPAAYGKSWSRGRLRAAAASHSHSNMGSKPHLQPTPQVEAMLDP